MVTRTSIIAPKMHYYLVRWRGQTDIRSCSEYLMSDEKPIALVTKDKFYKLMDMVKGMNLVFHKLTIKQVRELLSKLQ